MAEPQAPPFPFDPILLAHSFQEPAMSTDNPNPNRKPRKPAKRKNTKVTGERSEAAFLNQAANRDFGIAKPWGDSRPADNILEKRTQLPRMRPESGLFFFKWRSQESCFEI